LRLQAVDQGHPTAVPCRHASGRPLVPISHHRGPPGPSASRPRDRASIAGDAATELYQRCLTSSRSECKEADVRSPLA
jgi:hypothetical protein